MAAISYIDAPRFQNAIVAGIHYVIGDKDYINKINVFPVADADTGTNLAFTLNDVLDRLAHDCPANLKDCLDCVADAALDGARGNSGAIIAQYFEGFRNSAGDRERLNAEDLAIAAAAAAQSAWTALANPVEGTMPTVLQAFGDEMIRCTDESMTDIGQIFERSLDAARNALANTPNQLPVLKQAGVVDAGGQGFVDLLDGMWNFMLDGKMEPIQAGRMQQDAPPEMYHHDAADSEHRYCTECMVSGEDIARERLVGKLNALDSSSLVVAGSKGKLRVHIHTNSPAQVFLACEEFGQVSRQKADDIHRQQHLAMASRKVAIVTDSGADIPEEDIERHNIYMVPVRLNFGDQGYLDKVSITPQEFYRKLENIEEWPQTSQPAPGDFIRQYDLLVSHGLTVVAPTLSGKLSGTLQAAEHAASRFEPGAVRIVNTQNATAGEGLIALYAAEAAEEGFDADQIVKLIEEISGRTQTYAVIPDLSWGVRGGRIPAFLKTLAEYLFLNPVLAATDAGQLAVRGVVLGKKNQHMKFARLVARKLKKDKLYRFIICHCQAGDAAMDVQHQLLERHPEVHSCRITDAGPAVGVHLGPGGIVVGVQEYLPPAELLYEIENT